MVFCNPFPGKMHFALFMVDLELKSFSELKAISFMRVDK
jgi:hypothetical protein